ncbi:AAA family ATPase [Hoeflea sp. WL0058]|uniref:AAA family ATPase n=1 Tax=Flavimaribacter sediminis TaxID=2865987 RepID=A0AAE2ZM58_9HYPH|nr:AAA family ATPase [Flavimaribacter sediminis]MBW8637030.1 AAA family ATPase [Flavimaribacter sediminis]
MTHVSFERLADIIATRGAASRSLTAIAGPPGSGKSTVSQQLVDYLNRIEPRSAALLPMDGYHYDDTVLRERGLLERKGAPETFDTLGLIAMLERLHSNAEKEIAVPVFDRTIEISRSAARIIEGDVRHVVLEGNYLLLSSGDWSQMHRYYRTTVMLDVSEESLKERLEQRWLHLPERERQSKISNNDLLNGRLVMSESAPSEFILKN